MTVADRLSEVAAAAGVGALAGLAGTTAMTISSTAEAKLRGRTAPTAAPTAAVVGTVLSMVNEGNIILEGHATVITWVQVAVNYAVPYLVASIGWLSARRTDNQ